jgi:hypothetical protein
MVEQTRSTEEMIVKLDNTIEMVHRVGNNIEELRNHPELSEVFNRQITRFLGYGVEYLLENLRMLRRKYMLQTGK